MAVIKKFFPEIKIHRFDDLSKDWFITFRDAQNKRYKKQGKINQFNSYADREKAAQQLKYEYEKNYTHFDDVLGELEKWLQLEKERWCSKTYQCHWSKITRLAKFLNGRKIDNDAMKDFFSQVYQKGEGKTYDNYRTKFNQFFVGINRLELMEGIEKYSYTCTPARYFQDNQIKKLKAVICEKHEDLWFFIQIMANIFLRPKEIRLILVGDFMLEEEKVLVRKEISKNGKSQYVPILPNFLPTLKEKLKNRDPGEYLFQGKFNTNNPVGINTMYNRHLIILKELNYPRGFELYSWRHTGAVKAVKDGLSLLSLSKMMRHYNTTQTEEYLRQLGVFDFLWEINKYQGI